MERTLKEKSLALKVGIFAVIGIAILFYLSIRVGEISLTKREDRIDVYVVFDTVGGLEEKAEARLAGVVIGRVTRIYLRNGKAAVEAAVDRSAQLRVDATARITVQSMVGASYLEFLPVSATAALAEEGTEFRGEVSPGFAELAGSTTSLMTKLSLIADDMKLVSESVKNVIGTQQGEQQLKGILQKLDQATSNMNLMIVQNRQDVDKAVVAIREFAETLRDMTPAVLHKVEQLADRANSMVSSNQAEVREMMKKLNAASGRLNEVLADVQDITKSVKEGKGTIGKLIAEDTVHQELTNTLSEFRQTMSSAKDFLDKTSQIKAYLGYRGEYLTDEAEFKNYVTVKLEPREGRYFLFELANDPYGKEKTVEEYKVTETVTEEGGLVKLVRTHKYSETTRKEKRALFSLQYARRFGPVTFRGGLIESEGGFGTDLNLMNDRLALSLDAFDFDEDDYDPHLKFTGRFDIYKSFYITAGVDQILNEQRRSFYAGLGLMFREDDIKYIFSQMPTSGF
ncbi:MAG TPA: MlaD family protein [bacterium]|nr:MlaD family protein [bacterium]